MNSTGDAVVAAGLARDRRDLGETLVWRSREVDIASSRIDRRANQCRNACVQFTIVVGNVTTNFINIDCDSGCLSSPSAATDLDELCDGTNERFLVRSECREMLQQFNEKNRDLIVNINGRLVHRDEAGVSPFDSAVQGAMRFGKGCGFTTAASSNCTNISIGCVAPRTRSFVRGNSA